MAGHKQRLQADWKVCQVFRLVEVVARRLSGKPFGQHVWRQILTPSLTLTLLSLKRLSPKWFVA